MEDGETGAQHGLVAAEDLPGSADAGFEGGPIHVDARRRAHAILIGDQKLPSGGNVVGQASVCFGDRSGHIPGQAKIEGERWCDPPIVFDERAADFQRRPVTGPLIGLVVNGEAGDAEQEIGLGVARQVEALLAGKVAAVADDPEAILKGLSAHVHLIARESRCPT